MLTGHRDHHHGARSHFLRLPFDIAQTELLNQVGGFPVAVKGSRSMKSYLMASALLILFAGTITTAQTVGSTAPVITPVEYTTSSSPLSDGRAVTTYYAPQQPTPATRVINLQPVSQADFQPTIRTVQNTEPYYNTTTVQATTSPTVIGCDPCACTPMAAYQYAPTQVGYQPGFSSQYSSYRPTIPNQSLPHGVYVGEGLIGQPKAYVDGQPLRNFLRFVLP